MSCRPVADGFPYPRTAIDGGQAQSTSFFHRLYLTVMTDSTAGEATNETKKQNNNSNMAGCECSGHSHYCSLFVEDEGGGEREAGEREIV